jgi:hypothetical protein
MYALAEKSMSVFSLFQVKAGYSLAMLLSCIVDIGCASPPTVPHSLSVASETSSPTPKLLVDRSPDAIRGLEGTPTARTQKQDR